MSRKVYLAVGDSITFGQGASHPQLSFVNHVSEFVKAKSLAEKTIVVAQPGLTVKRLYQVVRTLRPGLWDDVAVATICMGSSDFARLLKPRRLTLDGNPFPPRTVLKKADEFGYHTDQLFRFIKAKNVPNVVVTTLFNPFPVFAPASQFIDGMNSIINDCASYYKFAVLDLHGPFSGNEAYFVDGYRTGGIADLMTPLKKPILPNNAGHKLIAHLMTKRILDLQDNPRRKRKPGSNRRIRNFKSQLPRTTSTPR